MTKLDRDIPASSSTENNATDSSPFITYLLQLPTPANVEQSDKIKLRHWQIPHKQQFHNETHLETDSLQNAFRLKGEEMTCTVYMM